MFIGGEKERVECAKAEAEARREAAAAIPIVRGVVETFAGKVYNCRFEKALKEAAEGKAPGRICARKDNRGITIEYHYAAPARASYGYFCLAWYRCEKPEKGKPVRIDGAKLCEDLRKNYETLLREAAEIEEQAPRIRELLRDIAHAEGLVSKAKGAVNSTLRDIYGIRF